MAITRRCRGAVRVGAVRPDGDDVEDVGGSHGALRARASYLIDDVVPLAEAWRSGAAAWSADQRERFANDLVDSQLIAVSASSNRSKGDQDPAEWKPPRRVTWCLYSRYWIQVKTTWKLTIDEVEKRAVAGMLDTCRRRR